MMTVGIPLIVKYKPKPKLTVRQKYLRGKKLYDYLRGSENWPEFRNLRKRGGNGQYDWINLAIS